MGQVEMQRLRQVAFIALLVAVAGCERSENASQALGPVITCIVFECPAEEFRKLVQTPVDANEKGAMGRTALMYASGIGIAISDRIWSRTGRHARAADRPEYVRTLLAAGAQVDVVDDLGTTALDAAIYNGNPEVVRRLLEAKANPNARMQSVPPLNLAALHCDVTIVTLLLKAGANADARDPVTGETAPEVARREGCESIFAG